MGGRGTSRTWNRARGRPRPCAVAVLGNPQGRQLHRRKHEEDRETRGLFDGKLDPYSSAVYFLGWKERTRPEFTIPPGYDPPEVGNAHTWLLTTGLERGRPISVWQVPSARP